MTESLQLQFFNVRTKQYVPDSCFEKPGTDGARRLAEIGRASGRSWRLTGPDRPLKPVYRTPRPQSNRTVAQIQRDYLTWAQAKGLQSVHVYTCKPVANYTEVYSVRYGKLKGPPIFTGAMLQMTLEEHFAVLHVIDMPAPRPDYHNQPGA